jgi:hypothetical protein
MNPDFIYSYDPPDEIEFRAYITLVSFDSTVQPTDRIRVSGMWYEHRVLPYLRFADRGVVD